jgi:4-amino-4-deoxy-L-arabinose transferase-like glycosyltransferase
MKKLISLLLILFIAAFIANFFHIVSIPWLDIPEVTTYTEKSLKKETIIKKLDD